jgi:hypothetical protein
LNKQLSTGGIEYYFIHLLIYFLLQDRNALLERDKKEGEISDSFGILSLDGRCIFDGIDLEKLLAVLYVVPLHRDNSARLQFMALNSTLSR